MNPFFYQSPFRTAVAVNILIASICYSNTLLSPFHFDDYINIVNNSFIKDISNFFNPFTRSQFTHDFLFDATVTRYIGYLTFALNYAIHGLDLWGYHLFNLVVHILTAIGVYLMIWLLIECDTHKMDSFNITQLKHHKLCLITTIIFVAHPIQTQAITYIVQRFASMATMFYVYSIVFYCFYRLNHAPTYNKLFYMMSLLCAVFAMKTKEIAFTLPFMLILIEYVFFYNNLKNRLSHLIPFILALFIIYFSMIDTLTDLIKAVDSSTRKDLSVSRLEYLFTQFSVLLKYIQLLIFPKDQNIDYDYPVYKNFWTLEVYGSLIVLILIFILAIYLLAKGLKEKSQHFKLIGFGLLWFFITISIESSIFPIDDVIFEHRLYLPSIGFLLSITFITHFLWSKIPASKSCKVFFSLLISLIILVLISATIHRNYLWQNGVTLWHDALQKSPNKARVNFGYGYALMENGSHDEAITYLKKAIQLKYNAVNSYYNLSKIYLINKDFHNAQRYLQEALKYKHKDAEANYHYALVLIGLTKYNEALNSLYKALELVDIKSVIFELILFRLAMTYDSLDVLDEARKFYLLTVQLNREYVRNINLLGVSAFKEGKLDKAIWRYRLSIYFKPDYAAAHYNLGVAFLQKGRYVDAISSIKKAIEIKPDIDTAYVDLSTAFYKIGNKSDACKSLQRGTEVIGYKKEFEFLVKKFKCRAV